VSPVLASTRAGNFVRALLTILFMALIFREAYLLWYFHTPAWTSRPDEIHYCGSWYEREDGPDLNAAQARQLAGGNLKQVMRSPVIRPIGAYRPGKRCPTNIFAKISDDGFVVYTISDR
jgi:hypothetical protein